MCFILKPVVGLVPTTKLRVTKSFFPLILLNISRTQVYQAVTVWRGKPWGNVGKEDPGAELKLQAVRLFTVW